MENILKYYQFSSFQKDESNTFNKNEIAYTILNDTHFLIFEKDDMQYNLYVARYGSKNEIGVASPEILELLVTNYDKSNPKHRVTLRQYLE